MKLIFFGTSGAVQTIENTNVSFVLSNHAVSILVDTSGTPTQYLLKAGIGASDLDVVILTHAHPDHLYALPSLIHNLWLLGRKKLLRVICNPQTERHAKQLIEIFSLFTRRQMFPIEWISMEDGSCRLASRLQIAIFPVIHPIPTSGVRITSGNDSLVYSSDTAPAERIVVEAQGAKALIHEATGLHEHQIELNDDGHSSAFQAGESAATAGAQTLFLCHFDVRSGPIPDRFKQEAREAFKGKIIVPKCFVVYEV